MNRALLLPALLLACSGAQTQKKKGPPYVPVPLDPPIAAEPDALVGPLTERAARVLIRDGVLLTASDAKPRVDRGWVRLKDGLIHSMGEGDAPSAEPGERVIDAAGRFVTPGLVDTHSHLGVYATPSVWAHWDGNEATSPVTAGIRAEEGFWPQDPGLQRAVRGGVTTIQVLPGSANLMGGRGVVLKLHPRRETRAMRFPGAKDGLKMACGENPKRVYGMHKKTAPASRMASVSMVRATWARARRYRNKWAKYRANPKVMKDGKEIPADAPDRDLTMETLAQVLDGEINVHVHCYRADEMLLQLKIAAEFGFRIRSFHHAVEAYKIRDVLAKKGVSVSTWADWWGFKIEAYDAVRENLALLTEQGARGILHTDSPEGIQRMNQEAAKAYYAGIHSGVAVSEHQALQWITLNPAWALGVDDRTGSLEADKMADVVIWDKHPFSVYARAEQVFVDGVLRHDAGAPEPPWSDFEVGQ